jgi:hypothetical protein
MYYERGGDSMTISLRLNKADSILFKKYAELNGITVSELVRRSVIERIEDEHDVKAYKEALAEFESDPIVYSLNEVEKELGLK